MAIKKPLPFPFQNGSRHSLLAMVKIRRSRKYCKGIGRAQQSSNLNEEGAFIGGTASEAIDHQTVSTAEYVKNAQYARKEESRTINTKYDDYLHAK